jgi:hypothetical protein
VDIVDAVGSVPSHDHTALLPSKLSLGQIVLDAPAKVRETGGDWREIAMCYSCRFLSIMSLAGLLLVAPAVAASECRLLVCRVTGRPGTGVFAGHPGWIDAYHAGSGKGIAARIHEDGSFELPPPQKRKPLCLIVMLDRIETPPFVVPRYGENGERDVLIPVEYACVPAGYPEAWDRDFKTRARDYYQSVVPRCTMLYGATVFDGPKIVDWGNKIRVSVLEGGPDGTPLRMRFHREPHADHQSAGHSDKETPRVGWRHGDVPVEPGETYTIHAGGYRSHGGRNFQLDAYVRPDRGDGYPHGSVLGDGKPLGGDLCALVFGNSHGQLVENHIRSEEWEVFIPHHRPATNWGQSFTSHGTSLAGLSFWAASGRGPEPVECTILVRPDGTWEYPIGPRKVAVAHRSPARPIIRYPEHPSRMPGYESYYELPCDLYQVAYLPDEVPLTPKKTYYVEVVSSRPILMYADGDYYHDGHAYYEALKVDRLGKPWTFHSPRWTLAMNIVTYAKPGGQPIAP